MQAVDQPVQLTGSSDDTDRSEPVTHTTEPGSLQISDELRKGGATSWRTSTLIVLSSHFVVMNTSGFTNSFGAIQSYFIDNFDQSSSIVSWIGSMQIFLYFFIGIFSGRFTDAGYFRVTFLTGSLASVIGIFAASFGSELWIMFLTLGLGVGLGNGLMSCPMLAVMSPYFSKRRGLAIGITMSGSCTGGLVYSGIMRQLIPTLGFAWTMRVIALIQLITLGMANICLRPRTEGKKTTGWVDWSAFRDARFNHYSAAIFLSLLGLYISIFFVVDYSRTSISPPFSYQKSLDLLLIFNGVSLIGRIGAGLAADRLGALTAFVPAAVATTIILFSWIAVETSPGMYAWTVFCGIFSGSIMSLFPAGLGHLTAGTGKPATSLSGSDLATLQTENAATVDPNDLHTIANSEDGRLSAGIFTNDFVPDHDQTNPTSSIEVPLETPVSPKATVPAPPKCGKRLSLNSVRILNKWLAGNTHHPYPSVGEIETIERQTGLSRRQILNWFANSRRRKKYIQQQTADQSSGSSDASLRDIPPRPATPFIQQSPFERWQNSPPEDEPSGMAAIARAVSGVSAGPPGSARPRKTPSSTAPSVDTSDSSKGSLGSAYSHASDGSLESFRKIVKKRRRAGLPKRHVATTELSQVCHRFQCTFCTETFKLKHTWSRHERTQHLSLEQWECSPSGPTVFNQQSELRVDHLAQHFKEGSTMADWKGQWGFDVETLEMVESSMPPYLIDYERNSPLPFTTRQGAPSSSTSAFELLQLELDYFYSNYVDTHHATPPKEVLHLEACCIIFGAEMCYEDTLSSASSWLRDLLMDTEAITNKARVAPMKSAARSRFTELRIHSKRDIFEDCKLETALHQYVDMLKLLNLEIGDDELQREACSVINHMPHASPVFANLLVALVYASTHWLGPFRVRAGLPFAERTSYPNLAQDDTALDDSSSPQLDGLPDQNAAPGITVAGDIGPLPSTQFSLDPLAFTQEPKVVSLNDGNMYRGLTRALTRYVARTISPLNPTSHIPTDEELQYQARWIMYDCHDVWNQTPADNPDWLSEFKRDTGFFQ
ncbi:hypothetical protein FGRMN_1897 [Fusarium graminum]|nr:hypothetical protein FGRMN_1897 [Fusarium graminum]